MVFWAERCLRALNGLKFEGCIWRAINSGRGPPEESTTDDLYDPLAAAAAAVDTVGSGLRDDSRSPVISMLCSGQ